MGNKKNNVRSRKRKLIDKQRHMMEVVRRRKMLQRGSFAEHSDITTFNLPVTEDTNKSIEKTTDPPKQVNTLDQDLFKQEANEDVLKGIERDNSEFEDQSEKFIVNSEGTWANGVRNCDILNPSINTVSGKSVSEKKQKTKTSVRNCRSATAATRAVISPLGMAPKSVGKSVSKTKQKTKTSVRNCRSGTAATRTVKSPLGIAPKSVGKSVSKKKQKTKTSVRNCRSPTAATRTVKSPLVIAPISVGNYQLVIGPITGSNEPFVTPVISLENEPLTIAVTPTGNDDFVTDNASAWSDPLSIATTLNRNDPMVISNGSAWNDLLKTTIDKNDPLETSNAFAWGDPLKTTPVGDDSIVCSNSFALNDPSKTTSIRNDLIVTSNASTWNNPLNTTPATNNPLVPGTTLDQISAVVRHDFTRFGQSVGMQLNALPLKNALELQAKIQQMIQHTCLALGQTLDQARQPGLTLTKPNNELALPDTSGVKNELGDDSDDSEQYYILEYS